MVFTVSLKKPHEFRRLFSKGRSAAGQHFVVFIRPNNKKVNRLGITASKKLGNAVQRNRIKRRIREAYRVSENRIAAGFDIAFVPRSTAGTCEFTVLTADIMAAMKKLGIAL